ncbi:hypothetical protein ACEP2J_15345 [Pseudomonas aeruginosa]|uniref:hypothetical protein n=1 Tax=Pseudomonas aeruginosa TaxID=287 RepID=UPI000595EDC3
MPGYQKTLYGPLIACDIGRDAMRAGCLHFSQCLEKLNRLYEREFGLMGKPQGLVKEMSFSEIFGGQG